MEARARLSQCCGLCEWHSCHEWEPLLLLVKRCKSTVSGQWKDTGMVLVVLGGYAILDHPYQ